MVFEDQKSTYEPQYLQVGICNIRVTLFLNLEVVLYFVGKLYLPNELFETSCSAVPHAACSLFGGIDSANDIGLGWDELGEWGWVLFYKSSDGDEVTERIGYG